MPGDAAGMLACETSKVNSREFAKSDYDYVVPCQAATCTSTIKGIYTEYAERIGGKEKQLVSITAVHRISMFLLVVTGVKQATGSLTAPASACSSCDPCQSGPDPLAYVSEPRVPCQPYRGNERSRYAVEMAFFNLPHGGSAKIGR